MGNFAFPSLDPTTQKPGQFVQPNDYTADRSILEQRLGQARGGNGWTRQAPTPGTDSETYKRSNDDGDDEISSYQDGRDLYGSHKAKDGQFDAISLGKNLVGTSFDSHLSVDPKTHISTSNNTGYNGEGNPTTGTLSVTPPGKAPVTDQTITDYTNGMTAKFAKTEPQQQ